MDRVKRDARKRERVWGIGASKKRLETRRDGRKMYVFFLLSFFFWNIFFFRRKSEKQCPRASYKFNEI